MPNRDDPKKLIEQHNYIRPDFHLQDSIFDNNNDLDAVDLNYNNNNNNDETYCSEAQCLSRRGRLGARTKERDAQHTPFQNSTKVQQIETGDSQMYSPNEKNHYPEFETFNFASEGEASQNRFRKPAADVFFCTETRNVLTSQRVARGGLPKQPLSVSSHLEKTRSKRCISFVDRSRETDVTDHSLFYEDPVTPSNEFGKSKDKEIHGFGTNDNERRFGNSLSTNPKYKEKFNSRSHYFTEDTFNCDSTVESFRAETEPDLNDSFFEEHQSISFGYDAQVSRAHSSPRPRESLSSTFSESSSNRFLLQSQEAYDATTAENFHEIPAMDCRRTCEENGVLRSDCPVSSSKHGTEEYPDACSPSMIDKNYGNYVDTESLFPTYSGRKRTESDFDNSANDFPSFETREKGACDFTRKGDSNPSNSDGGTCTFQGEFDAFECESCMHCSLETNSSYSDCGPECECQGRHSVSPELRDPETQVPEVRWTARLLGGDEQEVEAFKAKKIASMKK